MTQFERGAVAALRTVLRHLFDILYACNGLAPHRDHFSLLVLAPKFTKTAKPVFDRAYATVMQSMSGTRIRVDFENMITAYVDPNMPRLLKQCKHKTLNGWTADISIHAMREVVLALMHEWAQAVEDTSAAPVLQRIDVMSQKMWMEALESVWPPWVAALYLTEQHQFGNTVEELFHFLQTREPERSPARSCAPMTASAYGKCEKRRKMRKSWSCVSGSSVMYLRSWTGGIEWSRRRWDGTSIGVHAGFRERSGTTSIGKHQ